ncbi:MAG: HalD/BesD family halogenase, partial [Usitatibacteraceae bacterium]
DFLTPDAFHIIASEVKRLHATRIRKNFVMPDFNTDRRMSVLSGKDVVRESEVIASLYACQELRDWLASLTGTDIHTVLHDEEFLVVNFLDGERDTHGWHLDDPRYALIVVVESPDSRIGGCIEYVPDWKRLAREECFEPHQFVERGVEICRRKNKLRSDFLKSGDCYLLDAGDVLHRVSPMLADGSRKALNLAFDDRRYRSYGETATRLYA